MKKMLSMLLVFLVSLSSFATPPLAVNEKVLLAFNQCFKDAQEVVWQEYDGFYEARFVHQSVKSYVQYDAEGTILGTRRYYTAENLPLFIKGKLDRKFKDKTVFGVTEVVTNSELVYHVVLQDATHWTHVTCDAYGNSQVTKKYKKA